MKRPLQQPRLETPRLYLRALHSEDAPVIQQLAGRKEIADTTISVPHPYSEAQAREWIMAAAKARSDGKGYTFGMELKQERKIVGAISVRDINREHVHAEIGFWVGVDYWGQGYATEAVRAILQFGFADLELNRIHAHHMERNPASGKVLEKAGLRREGFLRQAVRKWDRFENVVLYAILREDWQKS